MRETLRRRLRAVVITLAVAFVPWPAPGHVVYGTTTLRLLTLQSDLVARVRIVDSEADLMLEDPVVREAVVVAEVLDLLKGRYSEKHLRFVQHGHGVATYEKGEEVVLFVQHIAKSRELASSPIAERVHWVSQQETGAKFALDAGTRDDFSAAVRAYAELEKLGPDAQPDALRRITVELLASPHETLATSAVRDVVLAADSPIVSARDLPVLEPVLASPQTPIGVRISLLAEVERRGLVEGPPRWAALIRTTAGPDRLVVVRAVGAHPSEPVATELTKLLARDNSQLVATAAVSLGSPRNDAAVAPLAKLLESRELRVRMAAIRGLGRIGTPAARKVLGETAATHPDTATQRRAAAEVKLLGEHTETAPGGGCESRR
jgi:hypothetical protein